MKNIQIRLMNILPNQHPGRGGADPRDTGRTGSSVLARLSRALMIAALIGAFPATGSAESAIAQVPLFLTQAVPPIAVIDMPKDQSLFTKAYNDYSDLNGDGLDTTYDNSITYAGYFDSGVCYGYSGNIFVPQALATDHYCVDHWSGNFLNWVTMSRMDIVRQILYGGKRVTDTGTQTVLERAYLPTDAHAWAKYYNGADISKVTPFKDGENFNSTAPSTTSTHPCSPNGNCSLTSTDFPSASDFIAHTTSGTECGEGTYAKQAFVVGTSADIQIFHPGDQVKIYPGVAPDKYMVAGVCSTTSISPYTVTVRVFNDQSTFSSGTGPFTSWILENLSQTGISFCNTTIASSGTSQADTDPANYPPLMRVAKGNYSLWGASEKWQCHWSSEPSNLQSGFSGGFRSNGNRKSLSGLDASAENPDQATNALGTSSPAGEFHVEVEACVDGFIVDARCKKYSAGTTYRKPIGLLQLYGDPGEVRFGLFTGSYNKNFSGGVLRSNVGDWSGEINADGTFKRPTESIVDTLDKLRIYGFSYDADDHYLSDGCNWQITDPLSNGEGNCRSWGNPISEIYLESLRYLAGKTATAAFTPSSSVLSLSLPTWTDPLDQDDFCSALDVLVFNTSVATYDDDQMDGLTDLGADKTAAALTDEIGVDEGINNNLWFVGNASGDTNDLCSAKTVTGLGQINGICPEAPSQHGSWLIDGAAWYAHTNRIRSDLTVPPTDTSALKVDTYGVQMANNVPRITVNVGGKTVTILPAYRLDRSCDTADGANIPCSDSGTGPFGTGTLVDFKVIEQSPAGGRYYVNWEDSNQGGDFDQDMWGTLSYTVSGDTITVTTDAVSASSNHGQGFGYIISGTNQDGPHFTSGIYGFGYTDAQSVAVSPVGYTNTSGGCDSCELSDPATSVTFTAGDTSAGTLQDPLYYAAKWGGFDDRNADGKPDQATEWDLDGDGKPDNYFFANDPSKLYDALDKALKRVIQTESSATSIATNSTRLDTESAIYQGRFKSVDWYGELIAYRINLDGSVGAELWDAADVLDDMTPSLRKIYTWNPTTAKGVDFLWANLDTTQQSDLNRLNLGGTPSTADTLGSERLDYLRGDRSNEKLNGGTFRNRTHVLGDIVNSNPYYVNTPDYRYFSLPRLQTIDPTSIDSTIVDICGSDTTITEACTYNQFRDDNAGRTPVVYVGANDGMLHAFDADTGKESFAYVPSGVYDNLANLASPAYSTTHHYFVDGSVNVGDAWFKDTKAGDTAETWHTVLAGSLGAGGRGVYALEVTRPGMFSAANVLWEYDGVGDDDLGDTIGQPTIVRLNDHHWYVMFANGYDSFNGQAILYLVRLDATTFTGSTVIKITGSSTNSCSVGGETIENGLSTPVPVDAIEWDDASKQYVPGTDRVTDYAYAGDLCGHLIKFDLTSLTSSNWSGTVLFTAKDGNNRIQPITARPEVGRAESGTSDLGALMVYFGTGSFFREGDNKADATTDPVNSFYAIRDDGGASVSKSDLVQQSIIYQATMDSKMVRAVSQNPIDYSETGGDDGWYLNLTPPSGTYEGERLVTKPLLRDGRIIFTTLIPAPANKPCEFGGSGWLMELDAISGGRLEQSVLDINDDGVFDDSDFVTVTNADGTTTKVPVSGLQSKIGIISTPGIIEAGQKEYKYTSGSSGAIGVTSETNSSGHGRRSWREIQ